MKKGYIFQHFDFMNYNSFLHKTVHFKHTKLYTFMKTWYSKAYPACLIGSAVMIACTITCYEETVLWQLIRK